MSTEKEAPLWSMGLTTRLSVVRIATSVVNGLLIQCNLKSEAGMGRIFSVTIEAAAGSL